MFNILVVLLALYVLAGLFALSSGRVIKNETKTEDKKQQGRVPTDDVVQRLKFDELASFELGVVLVFALLLGFVMVSNYGKGLWLNAFMVVVTLLAVLFLFYVMDQIFKSTEVKSLAMTVYMGGLFLLAVLTTFQFVIGEQFVGPRLGVFFAMFLVVLVGVFLVAAKNAAENLRRFLIYFQLVFFGVGLAIAMVSAGALTVPVLILSQISLAVSAIYLTS